MSGLVSFARPREQLDRRLSPRAGSDREVYVVGYFDLLATRPKHRELAGRTNHVDRRADSSLRGSTPRRRAFLRVPPCDAARRVDPLQDHRTGRFELDIAQVMPIQQ